MTKLAWDQIGERRYEAGVSHGVLYPHGSPGVPWNGLLSVNETPSAASTTAYYLDGINYHNSLSGEEFGAAIEAFTYPDEFSQCDGSQLAYPGLLLGQQPRTLFDLCYRTSIGNDLDGLEHGYKLHIIYNAMASPSDRGYRTLGSDPEPIIFAWDLATTPEWVTGFKPTSHVVLDTTGAGKYVVPLLEDILYGTDATEPTMPRASELLLLFDDWLSLHIVDNGDGTFTASGNDDIVTITGPTTFQMTSDAIDLIDSTTYTVTY